MRELILLDLTSKPKEEDLDRLKQLLSYVGATAEFKTYQEINSKYNLSSGILTITYDHMDVESRRTRSAGRKPKYIQPQWTIEEVKKQINDNGTKYVTEMLGISKSTLYRRLRYLRDVMGYTDDKFFF